MRIPVFSLSSLAMLTLLAGPVRAAEPLLVQAPAQLAPFLILKPAVRQECDIAEQFGRYMLEALADSGIAAEPMGNPAQVGSRQALLLTIVDVDTPPGAGWLGKMGMTVTVELKQGDRTIASKELSGRAHVSMPGTCNGLESATQTFSKKAAKWLLRLRASNRGATASDAVQTPDPAASAAAD